MGEHDIIQQILAHIPTINWSTTNTSVSLFETTIRYLGGMLSGYDLLTGPLAHLADNPSHVTSLLTQSINLANNLSYAFNTPSGVPFNELNLTAHSALDEPNSLATVGTLILEWTRLSDLSGDPSYAALAARAESYLLSPSPPSAEPFPGLLGMYIDPYSGEFLDAFGGWIGGADSFYEYLVKTWIYDSSRFAELRTRWIRAADSSIRFLASRPLAEHPNLVFLASFNGTQLLLESQHLACFHGGNFLLGGKVLVQQGYIDFGLELVAACRATYAATATQLGPEVFGWDPEMVPTDQRLFFERNGFYILDAAYQLRPEVIEAYYYAYRATRDEKYRDWAWEAFLAIQGAARRGVAYSSIDNVDELRGGASYDMMESFWFAEVLKYLFLLFEGDDGVAQVGGAGGAREEWVWNTEGHPLRVFGR